MKKILFYSCFQFLFCLQVQSQQLIIKGKIKCLNQHEGSSKGAENVVVVPAFMPARSTVTTSTPSGYFEFNTGLPLSTLQDKTITMYAISKCTGCREAAKRIFISEDRDRQNKNDEKQYVTIKDWMLKTNCKEAELIPLAADSVLNVVSRQQGQDLEKMTAATALVGTPAFLNFLTTLTTVVGATGFPTGIFTVNRLYEHEINYGQFLQASPMYHSANIGFNFSPSRDMSEAVFWNPSAMALSRKPGNISLLTNMKNNGKLSGFYRISDRFSLGAGVIFTMQDEFRRAMFVQNQDMRWEDSLVMELKEYAGFISPAFKINDNLSIGASVKFMKQDLNIPNFATVENDGQWNFTDSNVQKTAIDADLSATWKISPSFQVGANIMNITGSELYKDAFLPSQVSIPFQGQRSYGLGLQYKYARLNAGADILLTEDGLFDASLGLNFVPFNNALISAGLSLQQLSYSVAFRMKHFRIAFIDDNGWMSNERRSGKINILNGRIYGGFVFDLN